MATNTIREWTSRERPRERLAEHTPRALPDRELLAILIETGLPAGPGRRASSAVDVASDLLLHFRGDASAGGLRQIMSSSVAELCRTPGIGPAKATRILAGMELARRAIDEDRREEKAVRSAGDVFGLMGVRLRDLKHEEFHVLLLNTQNHLIRSLLVTRGTLDASLIHPREVFRPAISEAAAAVILVHNHPSGDPSPSPEDRAVTQQLHGAGELVGIPVLDHVVVGEKRYVSFAESGWLS